MIGFAIWYACSPPATDAPVEPPLEPLPWTFEDDEPSADIDLDAVGRAIEQAGRQLLEYDARDVVDAYLDRLDQSATAGCPDVTVAADGSRFWLSGCYTDDGTAFGGFLYHSPLVDVSDGQFVFSGDTLVGNARVVGPSGAAIDIQGTILFLAGSALDGSADVVVSGVDGGFGLDGAPPGWLADGPRSATIELLGFSLRTVPGAVVRGSGSLATTLPDGGTWAVAFSDNAMGSGPLSACDAEPGGTIAVRDDAGRWLDVTFDGPILDVTAGDAAACDGCGTATFEGAPIGTVCADLTPWLSWEALP